MAKDAQRTGLTVKTLFSAGGLVLIFFLVILVNVVISRANLRFDLTGEKLYSLSDGSRKIMDQMERDVVIKLFYSQGQVNLPVYMKTWADRVLDFLEEYEHSSKGKITVEVYDPKPDSEEEEWAVKYGIRGFNLPTGEKIFLGLVALSADQEQTIPFLDPTREIHLEYDITRIISRVQTNKKPRIGLMSGLNAMGGAGMNPMMQQQAQPWFFTQELGKDYDLVPVAPNATEIPENLDLLVLHHPKNVPDAFLYAVDQYVLAGGRLVVMADAYSVMDQDRSPMKSSIPQKLFKAWGVEIAPDKVVADFGFSTRLRNQDNQIEDNPLWISVPSEAFNSDQIVSAELNGMLFPLPGGMRKAKDSPYDYVSMVSSSTNAGLVDAFKVTMGVDAVRKDFKPEKETMDYMVSVSGKFKTAFPDGPPEAAENKNGETKPGEKEKPATPQLKEAASENVIMIFSDADFLYDAYYLSRQNLLGFQISQMFNDNLNMLLNTSEMLTGNKALISIRSRGRFERPFTKVQALEQKAQAKWLAREQELEKKVEETNQALQELERGKGTDDQHVILSDQQEAEIEKFTQERNRIRKELKLVRRNLRADIDKLGNRVKFVNIFLMPILVSLGGLAYALYRRKKSRSN